MTIPSVFTKVDSLQRVLHDRTDNKKIALVPTMGALHHGHMELVRRAFELADLVVVSIFINPKQFNKKEDLEKYPRMLEKDLELLRKEGDVIVFNPEVSEIYPNNYEAMTLDLGPIATTMEGEFRPGHFDGVVMVVNRLFEIVLPDYALFGLKDFQQFTVINKLVKDKNISVEIIGIETVRETSGLASSSRNYRLSADQMEDAAVIYKALQTAKNEAKKLSVAELKLLVENMIGSSQLELEYFEIVDPVSLQSIDNWVENTQACIACICGGVRLIDNIQLT